MKGMTKENFWNQLKKDYPEAVEHFCKWIDEYKREVGWIKLFGPRVKFHDLPIDMQNGIIARFDLEKYNGKEEARRITGNLPSQTRSLFADLQDKIQKRSIKLN